jgi:hypothetical protein
LLRENDWFGKKLTNKINNLKWFGLNLILMKYCAIVFITEETNIKFAEVKALAK